MKTTQSFFCPVCETDRAGKIEPRLETYRVKGEDVSLSVPRVVCPQCGQADIDPEFGDPTVAFYNEYRRLHGLLFPDQIRAIRDGYGLSQRAFAALLGMTQSTLARYETGSVQDRPYDELLRAAADPSRMADILSRQAGQLSASDAAALEQALRRFSQSKPLLATTR